MDAEAMKLALKNIRRNAGRKRLGLEDGESQPGVVITVGTAAPEALPDDEDEDESE